MAAQKNKTIRLIVFDLDGVIFEHDSFFDQMYDKYDKWAPKKRILEICDEYLRTDTLKAAELVIGGMWAGLPDKGYWEIIRSMKLNPGAKETIKELKRQGFKTMILTSAVTDAAEKAKKLLGKGMIDHVISNWMEVKDGKITGKYKWNIMFDGKGKVLRKFCREEGIKLKDVIMVGDNDNDLSAMSIAGLSIAFNTKSESLKKGCDIVISGKDLKSILEHV